MYGIFYDLLCTVGLKFSESSKTEDHHHRGAASNNFSIDGGPDKLITDLLSNNVEFDTLMTEAQAIGEPIVDIQDLFNGMLDVDDLPSMHIAC